MTTQNLPYAPGTRFSNSEIYDEATAELVHGWQVFIQKRPDGTPTGRRSFVDHKGSLCGIEIAEQRRALAISEIAPELVAYLPALVKLIDSQIPEHVLTPDDRVLVAHAKALLSRLPFLQPEAS